MLCVCVLGCKAGKEINGNMWFVYKQATFSFELCFFNFLCELFLDYRK